ncbi:MAG: hypothetical protein ACI85E_002164, partial [Marinomonas primoryensis]
KKIIEPTQDFNDSHTPIDTLLPTIAHSDIFAAALMD